MKASLYAFSVLTPFASSAHLSAPDSFDGLDAKLANLYGTSKTQSRSISPENFTCEKGKAGMATEVTDNWRSAGNIALLRIPHDKP